MMWPSLGKVNPELDLEEKSNDRTTDVATTSTLVMDSNIYRTGAALVNDGDVPIYLGLGHEAAANAGIRLNASGGAFTIGLDNLFRGPIYAIHGGAGTKVLCAEEWEHRFV